MKLLIVESPAKAKTISKILGPDWTIRATFGHIMDLPSGQGCGLGVNIEKDFAPKLDIIPDKHDKIKAILEAARNADEICIAADPDREGEQIAWCVQQQLNKIDKKGVRVTFGEITSAAIKKAIKNPREIDINLVDAQKARRVLDRIVGFMASPYISRKLGNDKLSAGRVQSVALKIIVERELDIEKFVPEVYFTINTYLQKDKVFVASLIKKVTKNEEASKIKEQLSESTFVVKNIKGETRYRAAAPPLTTSKLQQEASAKFKFDGAKTMKAAQELYEGGFITYIRSDSTRSSPESIEAAREYLKANNLPIPNEPNTFKNKEAAQDAHEAIRPTDVNLHPRKLSTVDDNKKIYELIWTMFLASQMPPAVFETVNITIEAISSKGNNELKAEGSVQKEEGWMKIASSFVNKTKDVDLPILKEGDKLELVDPGVRTEKKKTSPPPRFTDGTLVKELEKKEIGRPSTYASIISRISGRSYITKTIKGFEPTELGKKISEHLDKAFSFMDYKYTAKMEKKLDEIAEGKIQYLDMMTEFFAAFKSEFWRAKGSEGMDAGFPCPTCGDKMVVRKSDWGFFAGCIKYPDCKGIINIIVDDGKVIRKDDKATATLVENVRCPECDAAMRFREDGKFGPFYSCSTWPKCYGKRKVPFGKKCPECGDELFANPLKGEMKLSCMGYPKCTHLEDIPEGYRVNWSDPKKIAPENYDRKVEKPLKDYHKYYEKK